MKHDHIFDVLPEFEAAEPKRISNERTRLKKKAAFQDVPLPIIGKPYLYINGHGKMSYMPPVPAKAKTETINVKTEDLVPASVLQNKSELPSFPMDINPGLTGIYVVITKRNHNKHYSFWNGGFWATTTDNIKKAQLYSIPSLSIKEDEYAGWSCLSNDDIKRLNQF